MSEKEKDLSKWTVAEIRAMISCGIVIPVACAVYGSQARAMLRDDAIAIIKRQRFFKVGT